MAVFRLILMEEAREFLDAQTKAVSDKIYHNIYRILGGERDAELFKKLGNTQIWEFRTLYNGKAYRLFAFWDKEGETLIVATHGIVKKSQKTPRKEIARAEALREKHFKNKKNNA